MVSDVGIAAGQVANVIGQGVSLIVADAAKQVADTAITGKGSFNWSQFFTSCVTAFSGIDLVGDPSDITDAAAVEDDSVLADTLDATTTQAAGSLASSLSQTGPSTGSLGQLVQNVDILSGGVLGDLANSLVGSTFVLDTTAFLKRVSNRVSDIPFVSSAVSFLTDTFSGVLTDTSFADSGVSFLEQLTSDNLVGTPLADDVASFLDEAITGKLTGTLFAQGALSFLENSVLDGLEGSSFVQGFGSFLDSLGVSDLKQLCQIRHRQRPRVVSARGGVQRFDDLIPRPGAGGFPAAGQEQRPELGDLAAGARGRRLPAERRSRRAWTW